MAHRRFADTVRGQVAEAVRDIENREGRDARDSEVAESLGMTLQEYHKILQDATGDAGLTLDPDADIADVIAQAKVRFPLRDELFEDPAGPQAQRLGTVVATVEDLTAVLAVGTVAQLVHQHGADQVMMNARRCQEGR